MPRKFTKVYIVVEDNAIFGKHKFDAIETYRDRVTADRMCGLRQQKANSESQMHHNFNQPIPQYKVHAFYLIHEALF